MIHTQNTPDLKFSIKIKNHKISKLFFLTLFLTLTLHKCQKYLGAKKECYLRGRSLVTSALCGKSGCETEWQMEEMEFLMQDLRDQWSSKGFWRTGFCTQI
jgi:hypothetical protein